MGPRWVRNGVICYGTLGDNLVIVDAQIDRQNQIDTRTVMNSYPVGVDGVIRLDLELSSWIRSLWPAVYTDVKNRYHINNFVTLSPSWKLTIHSED